MGVSPKHLGLGGSLLLLGAGAGWASHTYLANQSVTESLRSAEAVFVYSHSGLTGSLRAGTSRSGHACRCQLYCNSSQSRRA